MLTLLDDALKDEKSTPPLDTRVKPVIRILNGALDDDEDSPGKIILNGRIDSNTLRFLKVDSDYQRPLNDRPDIFIALKSGVIVPNIVVGVRGQNFTFEDDDFLIHEPTYIIDGWQRVGNALRLLELIPDQHIRLFATVHFATDRLWERHHFTQLNKNVQKVSSNLHLRNMRDLNMAVATLFGLSTNTKEFPLYERVCWSQNMKRGEMLSAVQLAKVALRLHAHVGSIGNSIEAVTEGLKTMAEKVKLDQFRKNVSTYYEIIEECFGIKNIEFRKSAPQLKQTFMAQLARMFSSHLDFWDGGNRIFFMSADMRRKLAKFPLNDPHVKSLAGTGGAAGNILYDLLLTHMNSGKRTHRLRSRFDH